MSNPAYIGGIYAEMDKISRDAYNQGHKDMKNKVLDIIEKADTEFIEDYQSYFIEKQWIECEIEKL